MPIMELELVKFAFDVLKEIRDVFDKHKDAKDSLIAKGTLLELYGCATLIEAKTMQLLEARAPDTTVESVHTFFHEFTQALEAFIRVLERANFGVIEIWHPELAHEIISTLGADTGLLSYFRNLAHRFGLKPTELDRIRELYIRSSYLARAPRLSLVGDPISRGSLDTPMIVSDKVWQALDSLSERLQEFRRILAEVIRNNWEFKDLFTLPMKK
jgi:hypothetical protein